MTKNSASKGAAATATSAAPASSVTLSRGESPWYARPPKKHLAALIAVGALMTAWLGYLFWLAMVAKQFRSP